MWAVECLVAPTPGRVWPRCCHCSRTVFVSAVFIVSGCAGPHCDAAHGPTPRQLPSLLWRHLLLFLGIKCSRKCVIGRNSKFCKSTTVQRERKKNIKEKLQMFFREHHFTRMLLYCTETNKLCLNLVSGQFRCVFDVKIKLIIIIII